MTNRTRALFGGGRSWRRAAACACIMLSPLAAVHAQIIPIKTVPLAEGDQLGFFPSANLGMGGVSIAIADTLLDPFINPAKGARLRRGSFFGSPSVYSLSRRVGSGRTLPLGAITRSRSSFAGLSVAIQEINPAQPPQVNVFPVNADFSITALPDSTGIASRQPLSNKYVSAMAGRVFPTHGLSVGVSAFWSGLRVVDGVDQLYIGSQGVRQSGQALDLRFGLLKEWGNDRSFEAVVVHNRSDVAHDVSYLDFFWDPATRQSKPRPRLEQYGDRANTSGLHLEYEQPLADSGWRIGGLLTANRASHPKVPAYDFMNVPGRSSAFNLGVGLSKSQGPMRLGIDMIYEPIWSYTGVESIENRFQFSNSIVRAGVSRDFPVVPAQNAEAAAAETSLRLQLGIQLRSIHYWLDRYENLTQLSRSQEESWKEWTNALGASLRFPELEIHYRMRSASGAGRPGVAGPDPGFRTGVVGASILPGPVLTPTALALTSVRVTTHQFSVSVPIR